MTIRRALATLTVVALAAAGCGGDDDDVVQDQVDPTPMEERSDEDVADDEVTSGDIEGLVLQEDLEAGHSRGELPYSSLTPVGGNHNPFWQKCGHYTVEIPAERAVHSLEHGAVWIAYQPGTDVSALEPLVAADEHLLMSVVDGLDVPLMISAWGAQVAVDGPGDPRIATFIETYIRNGPEAAPCVGGGVGEPPTDIGPGLDA